MDTGVNIVLRTDVVDYLTVIRMYVRKYQWRRFIL